VPLERRRLAALANPFDRLRLTRHGHHEIHRSIRLRLRWGVWRRVDLDDQITAFFEPVFYRYDMRLVWDDDDARFAERRGCRYRILALTGKPPCPLATTIRPANRRPHRSATPTTSDSSVHSALTAPMGSR
jgi:hypothetical protein